MADARDDKEVFWVEPRDRAIIPLDRLHLSKSLRKALRQDRLIITLDQAFEQVIRACSDPRPGHEESWISERIVASYVQLHRSGHAHSLECWLPSHDTSDAPLELVGGLYGVSFDQVFCGESMFSRTDNSSKVALAWLVAMMRHAGFKLLDCQFMTDHLASMGAEELPQKTYLKLVRQARGSTASSLHEAYAHFTTKTGIALHSSPGKLIAQSLTQTS